MSRTADSKKQIILDYINEYYGSYGETPTVRDIAAGTGIAVTSVHRYLSAMKENGELEYNGRRSVSTRRMEMDIVNLLCKMYLLSFHAVTAPLCLM